MTGTVASMSTEAARAIYALKYAGPFNVYSGYNVCDLATAIPTFGS